jgi:hypothetical protein
VVEAFDADPPRHLEKDLRTDDVRAEETGGVEHGEAVVRLCREVDHDVDLPILERGSGELGIGDVAVYEDKPILQIGEALAVPCIGEQVVRDDLVLGMALDPVAHEVRADEPRSARDEEAHRHSLDADEEGLQPLTPVGQARDVRMLTPQHGIGRARRRPSELLRRDAPHPATHTGLVEDRLGELGPCAVAFGREVTGALGPIEHVPDSRGQVADVGRRATLVVDDSDLVPLGAESQHGPYEVVPGRAEEP